MPTYLYRCADCGHQQEQRSAVDLRNVPWQCACGGQAFRVFQPRNVALQIPEHFRLPRDWALPDAGDTAAWDARQGSSSAHAPRPKTFKQEFDETYQGDL